MADLWMPGAERVAGPHSGGTMNGAGGIRRAGWHITWDSLVPHRPTFDNVRDYLVRMGYEPHLMWDPETGRVCQFVAADRSGYAFRNLAGGVETNRQGEICIQIETFFSPGLNGWDVFTDSPMKGREQILAWLDGWGIPRRALDFVHPSRDLGVWGSYSGHLGHVHVPENDHTDPGPIDTRKLLAGGTPPPPPVEDEMLAPFTVSDPVTGETLALETRDDHQVWVRNTNVKQAFGALPMKTNDGKDLRVVSAPSAAFRQQVGGLDKALFVTARDAAGATWQTGRNAAGHWEPWYQIS